MVQTNPNNPALIERVAAVLRRRGAQEVYVFGSQATGAAGPESDTDFAVSGLPAAVFYRACGEALAAAAAPIDIIDIDRDTPFTRHLRASGELRRVG